MVTSFPRLILLVSTSLGLVLCSLERKWVLSLVISGFLFSCLHIYGQLPDFQNAIWQKGGSRNHEGHFIRVSDSDGEWMVDIAHSLNRLSHVKKVNVIRADSNVNRADSNVSMLYKLDLDDKSQHVDQVKIHRYDNKLGADYGSLRRRRNKKHVFWSVRSRNHIGTRNNTNSNSVDNRNIGRGFVHIRRNKHHNKIHSYNISTYITAEVNSKRARGGVSKNSSDNVSSQQQHHIFFLKVHKSASTTVHNIVMRFAMSKNLDVMLPKTSNILSETGYKINPDSFHPYPPDLKFNIVCNHVIFNKEYLSQFLRFPASTIYVGIVREPFSQFTSAFYYYLNTFKRKILVNVAMDTPDHPIRGFLENPLKHVDRKNYASSISFINNRMSADFGFPMWFMEEDKHDDKLIIKFLRRTHDTFHLVMVVDLFEESIVLLRRLLNWTVKDVLFINSNTFEHSKQEQNLHFPWKVNMNFTDEDRRLHRMYARVDYALYNHFREVLVQKIKHQPPEFMEEVNMFKNILHEVSKFCRNDEHQGNYAPELIIPSNSWTEEFTVSLSDCKFIQMTELELVNAARERQKARYSGYRK